MNLFSISSFHCWILSAVIPAECVLDHLFLPPLDSLSIPCQLFNLLLLQWLVLIVIYSYMLAKRCQQFKLLQAGCFLIKFNFHEHVKKKKENSHKPPTYLLWSVADSPADTCNLMEIFHCKEWNTRSTILDIIEGFLSTEFIFDKHLLHFHHELHLSHSMCSYCR